MDDQHPDVRIATALAALSSPTRLGLLRVLRAPKALSEIDLRPVAGPGAGRPLARQTVTRLLQSLTAIGMVVERPAHRARGETTEYVLNHQRVFALSEELRMLARMRPTVEPSGVTVPSVNASPLPAQGPTLILVHGLDEGTAFRLDPEGRPEPATWILGRKRGADVPLDFDPSASGEHAAIRAERGAHVLEDLGSRNGTTQNLRRLAPGERSTLRHGDLVGVGRSLLLYWA